MDAHHARGWMRTRHAPRDMLARGVSVIWHGDATSCRRKWAHLEAQDVGGLDVLVTEDAPELPVFATAFCVSRTTLTACPRTTAGHTAKLRAALFADRQSRAARGTHGGCEWLSGVKSRGLLPPLLSCGKRSSPSDCNTPTVFRFIAPLGPREGPGCPKINISSSARLYATVIFGLLPALTG